MKPTKSLISGKWLKILTNRAFIMTIMTGNDQLWISWPTRSIMVYIRKDLYSTNIQYSSIQNIQKDPGMFSTKNRNIKLSMRKKNETQEVEVSESKMADKSSHLDQLQNEKTQKTYTIHYSNIKYIKFSQNLFSQNKIIKLSMKAKWDLKEKEDQEPEILISISYIVWKYFVNL